MKRRVLAVLVIFVMVMSVTSCSSNGENINTDTATGNGATSIEKIDDKADANTFAEQNSVADDREVTTNLNIGGENTGDEETWSGETGAREAGDEEDNDEVAGDNDNRNMNVAEKVNQGNNKSPFSGKIIILQSIYKGFLYTYENAEDLYHVIDPNVSKSNKKFVELYETGIRYYEPELDVNFVYVAYDDDYGLELGNPGCKIYDFSDRDFSDSVTADLSTIGMEEVGRYSCKFGDFSFYQKKM